LIGNDDYHSKEFFGYNRKRTNSKTGQRE